MIKETITITNAEGISTKTASRIVEASARFRSQILIISGPKRVNGKSIMGVLSLNSKKGSVLELTVTGSDEIEAAAELKVFFEGGLN